MTTEQMDWVDDHRARVLAMTPEEAFGYGRKVEYSARKKAGQWREGDAERPSFVDIFLELAETVARRSTCRRAQVGCIVTDSEYRHILGMGYNGNYAGGPNDCDSDVPGACGCLHAELNALLKAGNQRDKVLFTTMAPCVACAKAIVNARVEHVVAKARYRSSNGLVLLTDAGVFVECENDE